MVCNIGNTVSPGNISVVKRLLETFKNYCLFYAVNLTIGEKCLDYVVNSTWKQVIEIISL